ncbi:hypothetical protein HPK19_15675 [Arthrobacter citreus]|nr:hypothetical protein HPK19_15675 [Arthrobacter citreus]
MMLRKKKSIINEIIYNHTTYYKGKYRYFPTITDLKSILEEIINSNSTTEYIRITPFYINEQLDMQIEYEEYMFYIECRESFDEKDQRLHISECLESVVRPRTINDFKLGEILYPLCKNSDVTSYKIALGRFKNSLKEILPKMMDIAKSEMNLREEDIAFGYFCFEIHSE